MSVLAYGCMIEIEPGITIPIESCSTGDLARARTLEVRKEHVREELARLVADAIVYDLPIPLVLREQVSLWDGNLLEGERLRDELRDALLLIAA